MLLCSCLESNCLAGCVFVIADYPDRMDHSILNTWLEVKIFFSIHIHWRRLFLNILSLKGPAMLMYIYSTCMSGRGGGEGGGVGGGALSHVVHTWSLNRVWILDLSVRNKANNCTQICPEQLLNLFLNEVSSDHCF